MARIGDAFAQFFESDGWPFRELEESQMISTGFSGDNGNWSCYAHPREEQEQAVFYSVCPLVVPETERTVMAEFLTRANYGLIVGNFEMDFNDGEVRAKTSVDVEGSEIGEALVKNLVYSNVFLMDRYLPGILKIISGGVSPQEVIQQIEG